MVTTSFNAASVTFYKGLSGTSAVCTPFSLHGGNYSEGRKKWKVASTKNTAKKALVCFTDLDGSLLRDKKNKE